METEILNDPSLKQIRVCNLEMPSQWPDDIVRLILESWLTSEEGIFLAEHSKTPLVLTHNAIPFVDNVEFTYHATLDEKTEIIWRLKFK